LVELPTPKPVDQSEGWDQVLETKAEKPGVEVESIRLTITVWSATRDFAQVGGL
jgi:hypothetical protein